jgi:hypothetical protein
MNITDIDPMPVYFDRYIHLVKQPNLEDALIESKHTLEKLDLGHIHQIGKQVYAPGKWTINEIFQHLIDTERVMSYRALRFARADNTRLPGFDENEFSDAAMANYRTLESIIEELIAVRQSTYLMFKSFAPEFFARIGICFDKEISVLGIGFLIVGHQIHHLDIIQQRYFPLLAIKY